MPLSRQAKTLNRNQVDAILNFLAARRNGLRNQVIFLLSVKAGLRAKEIALLRWEMAVGSDGELATQITLSDDATKGRSGRLIPLNKLLRAKLFEHHQIAVAKPNFNPMDRVVSTERSSQTSPQAIVNMFSHWYRELGLVGCSSHSGRRTFITGAARKIASVGGSLRDVQYLAGHSSLQTTERYIEYSEAARQRVVDIV